MEVGDVGGTGSTRGGDLNCKQNFGQKYGGQRSFGKLKLRTGKKKSPLLLNK